MLANASKTRLTVLLGKPTHAKQQIDAFEQVELVSSFSELPKLMKRANNKTWWFFCDENLTTELIRIAMPAMPSWGNAVFLHPIEPQRIPPLFSMFGRLAFATEGACLPLHEMLVATRSPNSRDLFILGSIDDGDKLITFRRGDFDFLTVPFGAFEPSGTSSPDFSKFQITDYGQTVKFGDYEAATDAILYEYDPEYRSRIAKARRSSEKSFGASLRRLRTQRRLRQEDFEPGVSARHIGRIERGETAKSDIGHHTLKMIAKRLKVKPGEIGEY